MTALNIHHKTTYRFHQPVSLGAHRLMLRPRESRDLRLMSHTLAITPDPALTWAHDVFGNAVAVATFATTTDMLVMTARRISCSTPRPGRYSTLPPRHYRFRSVIPKTRRRISARWRASNIRIGRGGCVSGRKASSAAIRPIRLSLLKDLSLGVAGWISYQSREDEGTQSPTQTLDRGWGSCRDFAVLFAEAARSLGFGARVVSGYLYNPNLDRTGSTGAGSTHAWAEVYVPGAGWITFDPTNRSVGGVNLIPVAVARDIRQAMPVSGSFIGSTNAFRGMEVAVSVTS